MDEVNISCRNFCNFTGSEMRVRGANNGRLLGDRRFSHGGDSLDPGCDVSCLGYTRYGRHMCLLHERHHNGLHWWSDPRYRHRAQQSAPEDRPRGHEDCRLQPRETARWSVCGDNLHIHVGVKYCRHCHDGAHHIRRSARTGRGIELISNLTFDDT